MNLQEFKSKLKRTPNLIRFKETIQTIENNYNYTPTFFINGTIKNNADENAGSCKLFSFAIHKQLTEEETLFCFGEHYENVLEDIHGTSHQNIRNFMKTGFDGLFFESKALTVK